MAKKWKCLITGALAGIANGLFGAGGGLFLVPLFTRWIGLEQKQAFATSVAVILPLSVVSAFLFFLHSTVELIDFLPFFLGGAVGGLLSGRVFQKIPVIWLRRAFGALILYGGIRAVLLL